MESILRKTFVPNVVTGVIVLLPVAIVGLVVVELLKLLGEVAKPLALQSRFMAALVVIAGLAALVVICFLIGTLVRTRLGATSFAAIERKYLRHLPGYEPITSILRGFAQKSEGYHPALVSLFGPGTSVFALIIEENADGTLTVFVPSAPTIAVGSIHVVDQDRVVRLAAGFSEWSGCVSQWGVGSRKLIAGGQEGRQAAREMR